MLKRKMYQRLSTWKTADSKKALILLGARQTGKTYLIRKFAHQNYREFIEVNFLEDRENGAFLAASSGAEELLSRLSLVAGHELAAGTLVFFDEVQAAGQIVTLSKFLLEDKRFDLILSGSLLGTELKGVTSFPVGYAHIERMYPLDFEEFCWASQVPEPLIREVKESFSGKVALEETLHKRFLQLFKQYAVVGGMPEAVQRFVDTSGDFGVTRDVQRDIIEQYRFDIAKYSHDRKLQIRTIFDNIPAQLAKENKRFVMKTIQKGATYERLDDDFAWLIDAGVAFPTYLVQEPKYPLLRTKVKEKFKLYSSDCGLLMAQYPTSVAMDVLQDEKNVNFGSVYEDIVAQELQAMGAALYYYHNNRKGEVDFLLEAESGHAIPIEVKSGKDYKLHTALNNLLATADYGIEYAYVFSEQNLNVGARAGKPVYYLPIYMVFCLASELQSKLQGLKAADLGLASWSNA
jgi:predicted AAA+ superfamily ATPase